MLHCPSGRTCPMYLRRTCSVVIDISFYNDCVLFPISDSKIIMIPKTGQLRIANVDENDLRHSYTCRIVNKLTGFTQESSTFGRIYFGKRIHSLSVFFSFYAPCLNKVGFLEHVVLCRQKKKKYIHIYIK